MGFGEVRWFDPFFILIAPIFLIAWAIWRILRWALNPGDGDG